MIQVVDMRAHGKLSDDVRTWLAQFNGPLRVFDNFLGGFVR
jgi:hypothetical protein